MGKQGDPELKKCLRCKYESATSYCPHCGQQMDVPRLSFKNFFVCMATELYLINNVFLYTAANLLVRPWKVIREYIHGRRDDYTSPVGTLVILTFIGSIIAALGLPVSDDLTFEVLDSQDAFGRYLNILLTYLNENQVLIELIMPIPALLMMIAVYWKQGARKYNLAEYLTAMIYLEAAIDVFGLLDSPLDKDLIFALEMAYALIICAISGYKAFPCQSHAQRILHYLVFLSVTAISYIIMFNVLFATGLM